MSETNEIVARVEEVERHPRPPARKAGRMKPLKCVRPGCRNIASTPNLICAKHLRAFKRTALYRGIQRIREQHPAPTPSPDRRVEQIRKWCENAIAYDRLTNAGTLVFARDILKICNSKGPR